MPRRRSRLRWLPLALAALAAVFVVLHWHEAPRILGALRRIHPGWLALAVGLQAGTYLAIGLVYTVLARALEVQLPVGKAARLSLVNLFVNNSIPSAGLSGNVFLVRMLTRSGVPAASGTLLVLLERVFYFAVLTVAGALALFAVVQRTGYLHPRMLAGAAVVFALAVGLGFGVRTLLKQPVRVARKVAGWIERAPRWLRKRLPRLDLVKDAQRIESAGGIGVVGPLRSGVILLLEASYLACDAATLWALFRGLDSSLSVGGAGEGFLLAQLLATVVVIPGTLEVGLAGLLTGVGARAGTAVLVALLYHALAFWLPMPFGWLAFQRMESVSSYPPRPEDSSSPIGPPRSSEHA